MNVKWDSNECEERFNNLNDNEKKLLLELKDKGGKLMSDNINNMQITLEQICAAILNKVGKVEMSLEELLNNYSSKSIAVDQDPNSGMLTFELAEVSEEAENE
jgi:hypothetical protein